MTPNKSTIQTCIYAIIIIQSKYRLANHGSLTLIAMFEHELKTTFEAPSWVQMFTL